MSYILEALKRSERQRQQGRVPDLNSLPVAIGSPAPSLSAARWPYALGATVVVLVVVGLGWWRPWQKGEPSALVAAVPPPVAAPAKAETGAVRSPPADVPPVPVRTTPSLDAPPLPRPLDSIQGGGPDSPVAAPPTGNRPAAVEHHAPRAVPPAPTKQVARAAPAPPAAAAARTKPARPAATPSAKPAAPEAVIAKPEAAPPEPRPAPAAPAEAVATPSAAASEAAPKRVVNFSELPASIQKQIPKVTVSGYSYAEESDMRMVVINDRVLREGDEVSSGVRLERIGDDGIVLSYKGFQFRPAP